MYLVLYFIHFKIKSCLQNELSFHNIYVRAWTWWRSFGAAGMKRLLSFCISRNISKIVKFIEPRVTLPVRNPPLFTSFFCREFTDSGTNMDLSNMRKSYKSDQEVGSIYFGLCGVVMSGVCPWPQTLFKRHIAQRNRDFYIKCLDTMNGKFLYCLYKALLM